MSNTAKANNPILDKDTYNAAWKIVSSWDFSLAKEKLLEPSYAGWTKARIEAAELNYKRYIAMTKALGGYQIVPNGDIDRFWHEHILDTRRYIKDCLELFNGFLHHYPYFGMRSEQDRSDWEATIGLSQDIWLEHFGEHIYSSANGSPQKCPQKCPSDEGLSIEAAPQKCPQKCPSDEVASIDLDYPLLLAYKNKSIPNTGGILTGQI